MNTLGEVAVLDQIRDAQILQSDDIKLVDEAAAVLVSKVLALPPRPLMRPCDHLAALLAMFPCGPLLRILAHRLPDTCRI